MSLPGPSGPRDAMRNAFGERPSGTSQGGETTAVISDTWVLGAAQWILWAGQGLFKQVALPVLPVDKEQITSEDWRSWRVGFAAVAVGEKYSEECRAVAKRAVEMMDALEKGMSF